MHYVAKVLEHLQPYVPLLQTLVWPLFLTVLLITFRRQTKGIIDVLRKRIESGSAVKAGPVEIGPELKALEYAQPSTAPSQAALPVPDDWEEERTTIYRKNYGVFLVHVITPSCAPGMKYDVFIYLAKHKSSDLSDVDRAEFFFGHMWGNKVYSETIKNGLIGISTSAYGPFLCTCRVHMKNGDVVRLNRYIDFEMGKTLEVRRS